MKKLLHFGPQIRAKFVYGFEDADRDTQASVDAIADQVREIQEETRADMKQLEGVIESSLDAQLQVALQSKNSNLHVRDASGNEIGSLKYGDNVRFTGDAKIINTNDSLGHHVFLSVSYGNGKTGYVSSEYLQGNLNYTPKKPQPMPELPKEVLTDSETALAQSVRDELQTGVFDAESGDDEARLQEKSSKLEERADQIADLLKKDPDNRMLLDLQKDIQEKQRDLNQALETAQEAERKRAEEEEEIQRQEENEEDEREKGESFVEEIEAIKVVPSDTPEKIEQKLIEVEILMILLKNWKRNNPEIEEGEAYIDRAQEYFDEMEKMLDTAKKAEEEKKKKEEAEAKEKLETNFKELQDAFDGVQSGDLLDKDEAVARLKKAREVMLKEYPTFGSNPFLAQVDKRVARAERKIQLCKPAKKTLNDGDTEFWDDDWISIDENDIMYNENWGGDERLFSGDSIPGNFRVKEAFAILWANKDYFENGSYAAVKPPEKPKEEKILPEQEALQKALDYQNARENAAKIARDHQGEGEWEDDWDALKAVKDGGEYPDRYAYAPFLRGLMENFDDMGGSSGRELAVAEAATEAVAHRLRDCKVIRNSLALALDKAIKAEQPDDELVKKLEAALDEIQKTYLEDLQIYTEVVGNIGGDAGSDVAFYENSDFRSKAWTGEFAKEAMDNFPDFDSAYAWFSRCIERIADNGGQSSGLQETYHEFMSAGKNGLIRLAQTPAQKAKVAKLLTDRSNSDIDGDFEDPEFAAELLEGAFDMDGLAIGYMEKTKGEEMPLRTKTKALRSTVKSEIGVLNLQGPELQEFHNIMDADLDNIQDLSQLSFAYSRLRMYELAIHNAKNPDDQKRLNQAELEGEIAELTVTFIRRANDEFREFIDDQDHDLGKPVSEIESATGRSLTPEQKEAYELYADITGIGSNWSDKTWKTVGSVAKITAIVAAGIAVAILSAGTAGAAVAGVISGAVTKIGVSAGAAAIIGSVGSTVILGGVGMTGATAAFEQRGFDNFGEFLSVYGTDVAVNSATLGAAKYINAGAGIARILSQGGREAVRDLGQSRHLLRASMNLARRPGRLSALDDAFRARAILAGAGAEIISDAALSLPLEALRLTLKEGGNIFDNLKKVSTDPMTVAMMVGFGAGFNLRMLKRSMAGNGSEEARMFGNALMDYSDARDAVAALRTADGRPYTPKQIMRMMENPSGIKDISVQQKILALASATQFLAIQYRAVTGNATVTAEVSGISRRIEEVQNDLRNLDPSDPTYAQKLNELKTLIAKKRETINRTFPRREDRAEFEQSIRDQLDQEKIPRSGAVREISDYIDDVTRAFGENPNPTRDDLVELAENIAVLREAVDVEVPNVHQQNVLLAKLKNLEAQYVQAAKGMDHVPLTTKIGSAIASLKGLSDMMSMPKLNIEMVRGGLNKTIEVLGDLLKAGLSVKDVAIIKEIRDKLVGILKTLSPQNIGSAKKKIGEVLESLEAWKAKRLEAKQEKIRIARRKAEKAENIRLIHQLQNLAPGMIITSKSGTVRKIISVEGDTIVLEVQKNGIKYKDYDSVAKFCDSNPQRWVASIRQGKAEAPPPKISFKEGDQVYVIRSGPKGKIDPEKWTITGKDTRGRYILKREIDGEVATKSAKESEMFTREQIESSESVISTSAQAEALRQLYRVKANESKLPLTAKEFDTLFNGPIGQKNVGNCYLISALHSMQKSPMFGAMVRSSIKKVSGGWEVTIPLMNPNGTKIKIRNADIKNELPNPNYGKPLRRSYPDGEIQKGSDGQPKIDNRRTLRSVEGPQGYKILEAAFIHHEHGTNRWARLNSEGGFGDEALMTMVGQNFNPRILGDFRNGPRSFARGSVHERAKVEGFLDTFDPLHNMATVNTTWRGGDHDHSFMVGNQEFFYSHAYSIKSVNKFSREVTVVNPWNTAEPITLSYREFHEAFNSIHHVEINHQEIADNLGRIAQAA